jgi:prolyl-tRNA synthetase
MDATGASRVRPAEPEEAIEALGASPGSLGAVGVTAHPVIVDEALRGRTNMTTGANEDDWHWRGVDITRDLEVTQWADLREVSAGEPCPTCANPIEIVRCIEIGHIFKLGTVYAEKFGVTVADADGKEVPVIMGSYGIGIGRNMAAAVEANYDDSGIIWPVSIAPFECVITLMRVDDDTLAAGEKLYTELKEAGVDVLLDDRDARAGVKFADAELVGIPFRLTVGPKGLASGEIELTERRSGDTQNVALGTAANTVAQAIATALATSGQ